LKSFSQFVLGSGFKGIGMYKVVMTGLLLGSVSLSIANGAVAPTKKVVKAQALPKILCKDAAPVREPFCLPWGGWYCGGGLSWITFTSDYNDAMAGDGHHVNAQIVHHGGVGFDCFGGYGLYPFKNNMYCGLELRAAFSTTHGKWQFAYHRRARYIFDSGSQDSVFH
jgi:hypothetical protein